MPLHDASFVADARFGRARGLIFPRPDAWRFYWLASGIDPPPTVH